MSAGWYLPVMAFVVLAALERAATLPRAASARADHVLNFAGLAIQGAAIPVAGYLIATHVLAPAFPEAAGRLAIGWWGAFALNVVVVDFLYYVEHRLFHRVRVLWPLHRCHHASTALTVWATSRNALLVNVLFVYFLVNPVLGFLCDQPDGFFFGAAVTASLDLWRHARLPATYTPRWLGHVLVTPLHHHLHHSPDGQRANFGANWIVWDRLFGTAQAPDGYPARYGTPDAPGPWRQFLLPW